ncbi:MAG: hypothetical protein MUE60_04615 [Candidatus Eisenbacteria bacterium]|jgi:hypothetical protein|nr:hypothetical protein [Candidatus Eisenbacteria bacterium]
MHRGFVIPVLFLACAGGKGGQEEIVWKRSFTYGSPPVQVTVNLESDSLTAASTVHVELIVEAGAAIRAGLPDSVPLEGLLVRSSSASPPEPMTGGGHRERARLVLEPMLPGMASIGPIVVPFEQQEGDQWIGHRLQTARIDVAVASLGVPEQGPIEFKAPRGPAWPRTDMLPYVVAGITALAAVFGLVYWLTVRRARKAVALVPPDRLALRELSDLERRDLIRRGELRRFYGELTDIVRSYLDRGFGIPAPDLTTDEVAQQLRTIERFTVEQILQTRTLLDEADLVKFAKFEPGRDTAEDRLLGAKAFVRATAPGEEPGRAV